MYLGSADFDTRSQAPLLQLSRGASFKNSIALDLVNRQTSTLIITELRSHIFEAFASTLALTVTSFLIIFSASLFYATTVPTETLRICMFPVEIWLAIVLETTLCSLCAGRHVRIQYIKYMWATSPGKTVTWRWG
ncbi:hypothetical protein F4818DRAFT_406825 [Hypoxylon cercidicola]|nr:hypothetical protein F4818DRAFT_406825 [Hypoxylon cercidicola]